MKVNISDGKAEQSFRVSVGYATAAAEEISGDTAISCGLPDGSLALILSDGMGKGIRAAADSRTVVHRLRKNLKSGMPPARAIKEVNRYMIERSKEIELTSSKQLEISERKAFVKNPDITEAVCEAETEAERFATVDLLLIDRNAGKAKFYKMGAASSFLIRNGTVRAFEKAALPVGMISGIKLTHLTAELKNGDVIVMVSDGITEADRSDIFGKWLPNFLYEFFADEKSTECVHEKPSVRKSAKYILDEAIRHYGEREQDDLTVAVLKITICDACPPL